MEDVAKFLKYAPERDESVGRKKDWKPKNIFCSSYRFRDIRWRIWPISKMVFFQYLTKFQACFVQFSFIFYTEFLAMKYSLVQKMKDVALPILKKRGQLGLTWHFVKHFFISSVHFSSDFDVVSFFKQKINRLTYF